MMTRQFARAVIGAGYGDEGKGLLVDSLAAATPGVTVVRFNGGAQAGHTVTTPDGRRHVFHHLCAGALAGAESFLSRFFVVNPILFAAEADALAQLGANIGVAVDPRASVTLPADMMINQIVERGRGNARHGSCGLGIGETIERNLRPEFAVTVADLVDRPRLQAILSRVRKHWTDERLATLGRRDLSDEERALLADTSIDEHWLDDVAVFSSRARVATTPGDGPLIFEGGQGLKLDQTRGAYPFVTRSNTGSRNVVDLAHDWGVEALDLIYVTRCYRTRHGAGPLAHEHMTALFPGLIDATNLPNPWQGTLRFAPLDLDELAADILADCADASGLATTTTLAMTCLDQAPAEVDVFADGGPKRITPEALARMTATKCRATRLLTSFGPTRKTLADSEIGDELRDVGLRTSPPHPRRQ